MALAPKAASIDRSDHPTSVHPQETSAHPRPGSRYRDRLVAAVQAEYDATDSTYAAIDRRDFKTRSYNMLQCKQDAWLSVHRESRMVRVISQSCRLRWCPICSKAKAYRISEAVTTWLETHRRPKILTLTLRHSNESLDSQITRLYACFREFRRVKFLRNNIHGGIWFFQVKWIEETSSWHPHLHCLLDSEYLPHAYLKQHWKRVTGDSDIVDIRVIYKPQTAAEYVARYASRPCLLSDLPEPKRLECVDALHGRRLCGKWGSASEISWAYSPENPYTEYTPVARFSNMHKHVTAPGFAQALWQAYSSRTPLPLCWQIEELDTFESSVQLQGSPEVDPHPQLMLPF